MRKNLNQRLENAFSALDEERVKSLLAAGADKKRRVRNELLMSSIGEPCFESNAERTKRMKLLLANGAKVNLRDKSGKTALAHSLTQKWGQWNNCICDEDDDHEYAEAKDNFSATFYYEIPKILLSNGAHVDIKDKFGKNAMNYAAADEEKMDLFARAIGDSNKFLRKKIVVMSK